MSRRFSKPSDAAGNSALDAFDWDPQAQHFSRRYLLDRRALHFIDLTPRMTRNQSRALRVVGVQVSSNSLEKFFRLATAGLGALISQIVTVSTEEAITGLLSAK